MRFIYADPGLLSDAGHHANFSRIIRDELIRRGIGVMVLAHVGMTETLLKQLNTRRLFRVYTYHQSDNDPIAGWLNAFQSNVAATVTDLNRLASFDAADVVYLASAQPAQFMAMVIWIKSLPVKRRPRVIIKFGADPALDLVPAGATVAIRLRDYQRDPRPPKCRYRGLRCGPWPPPRPGTPRWGSTTWWRGCWRWEEGRAGDGLAPAFAGPNPPGNPY